MGQPMTDMSMPFVHRVQPGGIFQSICLRCFQTTATSWIESELEVSESNHACKGFNMDQIYYPVPRQSL